MTSSPAPAERLAALLETLPSAERQEITAWLLAGNRCPATPPAASSGPGRHAVAEQVTSDAMAASEERVTSALVAGEETQLITIRIPAERHSQLRQWCSDQGFTMAAVVRGLVERFIDQQTKRS